MIEIKSIRLAVRVHANYVQTSVRFNYTPLDYTEFAIGSTELLGAFLRTQDVPSFYDTATILFRKSADVHTKEGMTGFDGYLFIDLLFENVNALDVFTVMELRYVDPSRGGTDLAPALQNAYINNALRHKLVQTLIDMIEARDVEAIKNAVKGMSKAS